MILFAFYGRVGSTRLQDVAASRVWQVSRARQLIQPRGGVIVAEYFDIGHTRALPWQRRPKASQLLAVLRDPARGFDAVVIGEPQRAFYGNQFSLTYPVFEHFGVQLWVPEVGGPIDPGSEAHDLAMTLFGSQSKGERMRIKTRVRAAMAAQTAIQGRYLGGRPPYGYRLADAGPHPNPAKARLGARLHTLEPDPVTAPVVARIYRLFLDGLGYLAIAERLNADQLPSPSGHDPGRNPHRQGIGWTKHTIRAILVNPRYTGYQVWNRQRRDEVLLDIDDVAAGYVGRMRWNPTDAWIYSEQPAHQPLISKDDFDRVQALLGARAWQHKPHTPAPTPRVYLLRKRLRCGLCQRRLQGHWVHAQPYYRCSYPPEYRAATGLAHPRTIYLREADLLPHLDRWLARLFDPDHLDDTLDTLEQASNDHAATAQQLGAAEQTIADCHRQLAQYRAALGAGADPTEVTAWINQATAAKAAAEDERARLRATTPKALGRGELRRIVTEAGGLLTALDNADRTRRATLYERLGVEGEYQPAERLVVVTADLVCQRLVSEGASPTFGIPKAQRDPGALSSEDSEDRPRRGSAESRCRAAHGRCHSLQGRPLTASRQRSDNA